MFRLMLFASLLAIGCSDDEMTHSIFVSLRTDFVPGVEFASVRTRAERPPRMADRSALIGEDFTDGIVVADLDELRPGEHAVRVQLLTVAGEVVAERTVRIALSADLGVTVVISRRCAGTICAVGETCVAGMCASDRCGTDVAPDTCPSDCTNDGECTSAVACVTGRCVGGECLSDTDDASCGAGMSCHPERGCEASAGDGGIDAGTDAGGVPDAGAGDTGDACVAMAETCDDLADEDCDGFVDEGCCSLGETRACGTDVGTCSAGAESCNMMQRWVGCTAVGPGTEVCNADRSTPVDEDCDGIVDEGVCHGSCRPTRISGEGRYLLCTRGRNYVDARITDCERWGYDLVLPTGTRENNTLSTRYNNDMPGGRYWVGVTWAPALSRFAYTDGSFLRITPPWATGEPDMMMSGQECVSVDAATGEWRTQSCGSLRGFICETAP